MVPYCLERPRDHVVLYSGTARAFRTTLLGYVYELCQEYSVTLLAEELDPSTRELLKKRELFPHLAEIVPAEQYSGKRRGRFATARRLCRIARWIISTRQPVIVVATSDNDSLLELFLMRFARETGALTVSVSCTLTHPDASAIRRYVDLTNLHHRTPRSLPLALRWLVVHTRRYAGHAFTYWILPLICGERPFGGQASYILHRGLSGMRDAKVQVVMHEMDRLTYLRRGVPAERLVVLPHPLKRAAGTVLRQMAPQSRPRNQPQALFLWPENSISFQRRTGALIPEAEVLRVRLEILAVAARVLPGWTFFIKPHPLTEHISDIASACNAVCPQAILLPPAVQIEDLFQDVDAVIELPRSGSTALYSALLWSPQIPKITLNVADEFYADYYRDFPGVAYVTTLLEFETLLRTLPSQPSRAVTTMPESTSTVCDLLRAQNSTSSRPAL